MLEIFEYLCDNMFMKSKRYFNLFVVLLPFCLLVACSGNSPLFYTDFQKAMLEEVNFARTKPAEYAEQRLKSYFDSGKDNGAYTYMKAHSAVPAVELQNQLCSAAQKYAKYMAAHNKFGHNENGSPSSRCKAEGYNNYSGENIAAGGWEKYNAETDFKKAAEAFVLMFIVDEGVPGVGHRKNIMNGIHKKLGVGFYRYEKSKYRNYVVQDFGSF